MKSEKGSTLAQALKEFLDVIVELKNPRNSWSLVDELHESGTLWAMLYKENENVEVPIDQLPYDKVFTSELAVKIGEKVEEKIDIRKRSYEKKLALLSPKLFED